MAEMAALGNAMRYTLEDALPNKYFNYIIDIVQVLDFHNARKWMSETYGYTEDLKKDQTSTENIEAWIKSAQTFPFSSAWLLFTFIGLMLLGLFYAFAITRMMVKKHPIKA